MSGIDPTTTGDDLTVSDDFYIDGRDPAGIEHLCAKGKDGHEIVDGPVEDCCADLWRADGVAT